MAGPLLEVFRFALYLSLPLGAMIHYGKPEWYTRNVLPVSIMGLSTSVVCSYLSCHSSYLVQRENISAVREHASSTLRYITSSTHPKAYFPADIESTRGRNCTEEGTRKNYG